MRRSIPTIRSEAAMKITGIAALEDANLLKREEAPDSVWIGAVVFLEVLREAEERAGFLEELLFEPLEEPVERDLAVPAIISRYLLFP